LRERSKSHRRADQRLIPAGMLLPPQWGGGPFVAGVAEAVAA